MRREEHCKQILLACVGSAHSAWTTLGLPQLKVACAIRVYTAQAPGCSVGCCLNWALHFAHFPCLSCSGSCSRVLSKGTDLVGHAFCALPRSKQLRQPDAWCVHCPRCALYVPWGADLRLQASWQMSTIQDLRKVWLATGSLLTVWWRMPVSGAKIGVAPCLLALAVPRLPLCLQQWGGACTQPASSPLVFSQSFVLWAGQAAS